MRVRERLEWFARMALLVFILAAAAFLSGITAIRFAIHGREVPVPNLVGKRAGDAQAELAARRLGFKIADRFYSDLPVDFVVRQSPGPGARVKVPQRVHVVLSLGPRRVAIPVLEGKSVRVARIELLRAGLQVGEISNCHLPEQPPELVLRQSPPPGAAGVTSPRVNLLVSLGEPEPAYVMLDVVGLPLAEAQRQLAAAGLRVEKVTNVAAPGAARSTVVQQTPARGARISGEIKVELGVAE